jgi:hypothetical protein
MTIREHFAWASQSSTHSLEEKLLAVSAMEYQFNPKYDKAFKYWPQLFRHCRDWVKEHGAGPYVEYKTEADIMNWGMNRLRTNEHARVLPSWMATIKRLRALAANTAR